MPIADSDKDRFAVIVEKRWLEFQRALSDGGRRYPTQDFRSFVHVARRYIAKTEKDPLVHRKVVNVITDLPMASRQEASRFRVRFWLKPIDWNA